MKNVLCRHYGLITFFMYEDFFSHTSQTCKKKDLKMFPSHTPSTPRGRVAGPEPPLSSMS